MMKSVNIAMTGSSSMVGKHIQLALPNFYRNYNLTASVHSQCDLRNPDHAAAFVKHLPDGVVLYHLAGYNGNIQFNKENPTDIYFNTVSMGLNLLRQIELQFLKRGRPITLVNILTSCAYPDSAYLHPDQFFNGKPHDSVECHGLAKRTLLEFSRQLAKKYWPVESFNNQETSILNIVPATLFGPFDSTDPAKTKVIGSMLSKFLRAKSSGTPVTLYGTGSSFREFTYVEDFVENLLRFVTYRNNMDTSPGVVYNFGAYQHIRILDLARLICSILHYDESGIIWDVSKPDGQPCKKLIFEKTLELFKQGGIRYTDNGLEYGLRRTIEFLKYEGKF